MRVYDFSRLAEAFPPALEPIRRPPAEDIGPAPQDTLERPSRSARPALVPAELDDLLASVGPNCWHTPMLRVVAKFVAQGRSDDDIHALTEGYTLAGYTVSQTRLEVQGMIDGARRKGFDEAKPRLGALKPDVPPAYPAEPLAAGEASALLRSTIEGWFSRAIAFAQARRDLKGMRSVLYGPDFLSQVRAELVRDGILPAPLEEVPALMSRHERRIRAREWRRMKKRLLEERGLESLSRGPRLAIQAAAGLGKTIEVVRFIMAHPELWGLHIWIFVPSLDLAEQLAKSFVPQAGLHGPYVRIMRGRLAKAPEEREKGQAKTMCFLPKAAELAGNKLGLNVYKTLCKRGEDLCLFYGECPWIAQFEDTTPGVRIFCHEYLFLPKLPQLPKPDLVVIDESFVESAVGRLDFLPDRLVEPATWKTEETSSCLQSLRAAIEGYKPLLAALREAGMTKREFSHALAAAEAEIEDCGVTPGMGEDEAVKRLSALEESERVKIARALRQLVLEFDLPRELCHALHLRRNMPMRVNGVIERQNRIVVAHRRKLILPSRVPALLIDADADAAISRRLFGEDLEHVTISVARRAEVVQCYSSVFSKQSLLGFKGASERALAWAEKRLALVKRFIQDKAQDLAALAVTNLPIRRKLTGEDAEKLSLAFEWGPAVISHFGRIRGIDLWKDRQVVIVIGREQPPPEEIETLARGLYCDDPEGLALTGAYSKTLRGYRLKDGRRLGIEVDVHKDVRVQGLLELKRERESCQAVDRIRLVHCDKPKLVFLLSNVPLDIDVDRLVSWKELTEGGSRLQRAWLRGGGVLCLSRSWLVERYPDLFPTKDVAGHCIKSDRLDVVESQQGYIGFSPHLLRFRPVNARSGGYHNWSKALLTADTPHFRAKLAELMGCSLEWEFQPTGKVFFKMPRDASDVTASEPVVSQPAAVSQGAEDTTGKDYPASWDEITLTPEEASLWEPGMDSIPEQPRVSGEFPWPEESLDYERRFGHQAARLYPFLNKRVLTRQGGGVLWQVGEDRLGVALDADPGKVAFMPPADVRPTGPLNGGSAS